LHPHFVCDELNNLFQNNRLKRSTCGQQRNQHRQISCVKISKCFDNVAAKLFFLFVRHFVFDNKCSWFKSSWKSTEIRYFCTFEVLCVTFSSRIRPNSSCSRSDYNPWWSQSLFHKGKLLFILFPIIWKFIAILTNAPKKVEPATIALALSEDLTVTRMLALSVMTEMASISSLVLTVIFINQFELWNLCSSLSETQLKQLNSTNDRFSDNLETNKTLF
jgi:hypothetical protein